MKKMISMIALILTVLTSATTVSATDMKVSKIDCLLNKSNSLVIQIDASSMGIEKVVLSHRNFLEQEGQVFATLDRLQVIHYGNVLMISQNNGRSGYAFLRLEHLGDGRFDGWFDINLFLSKTPTELRGRLVNLPCTNGF